jgi:hypothetical protein
MIVKCELSIYNGFCLKLVFQGGVIRMKKTIVGFLLFLALVSISCRLLAFGVNPAEVESMVAATLTAQPTAAFPTQVVEPLPPTSEPSAVTVASLHRLNCGFVRLGPDVTCTLGHSSSKRSDNTAGHTADVTDVKIYYRWVIDAFPYGC